MSLLQLAPERISALLIILIGRAKQATTLVCSIEISHDIYIYSMSVCRFVYGKPIQKTTAYAKMRGRNYTWPKHAHAQSQFGAIKTDL